MRNKIGIVALGAAFAACAAHADPATGWIGGLNAAAYVVAAPAARLILPSNTRVTLQVDDQLNSGALKKGSRINLSVAEDVKVGDIVAIPAGARAEAEVSWRTGRGAFGKSGKIEFDLLRLHIGNDAIPIAGHYRVEGHGAPWAAAATVLMVGWPGLFVTGHSAKIEPGAHYVAYTRDALAVAVPPRPIIRPAAALRGATSIKAAAGIYVQTYEGRKAGQDDAIVVPM